MRVVFFGTPDFAVPSLQALIDSPHEVALVVAQPDRPAGRGMKLHSPPVIEHAHHAGLETLQPEKIRADDFLTAIRQLNADAGIVVAYGRILPQTLLEIPRHGFLNVHASLLPKYRGAAPIQRAIENGETTTGVTIMRVDRELDHGPILLTDESEIAPNETAPELASRLAALGGARLLDALSRLESGALSAQEQDHDRATFARKIEKCEGRVDWSRRASEIFNRFRAFTPWPGLFTTFRGETLKLPLVSLHNRRADGPAGTITAMAPSGIEVAAGDGTLLHLVTMQRAGRAAGAAAEVARGLGIDTGMRFE